MSQSRTAIDVRAARLSTDPARLDSLRPLVASVCQRYLRGQDVDDAIQATFLRLLRATPGRPIASPEAWLTRAARSVCLDMLRRRKADRRRMNGAAAVSAERDLTFPLRHAAIRRKLAEAMREIDASDRRLVLARFIDQLPLRAIALETSLSVATVSRQTSRAIRALAGVLHDMGVRDADEHVLAEHFAEPAYAAAFMAGQRDGPLRLMRDRRSFETASRSALFGPGMPDAAASIAGPRMPGWVRPIRVGVMVHYSTTLVAGKSGTYATPDFQVRSSGLLVDPRFDLIAVVEPGTSHLGPVERTIRDYELLGGLIEATDVAALASLDVLLLGVNFRITMPVVEAIRRAIRDHAVGFLKESWIGATHQSQLPTEARDLMLAASEVYSYHMPGSCHRYADATVAADSPVLAMLGVGMSLRVSGCGPAYLPIPGATVHIARDRVIPPDVHALPGVGPLPMPLYLSGTLGHGRVVVVNDPNHVDLARHPRIERDYFPRLMAWLADPRRDG